MPFYIRKSLRVGPLRFNMSKSGIGVSAGIPGFRVGTGPRGNYIHMGKGGLYYRRSLPSYHAQPSPKHQVQEPIVSPKATLEKIDSACVSQMTDASSAELLDELNQKHKLTARWPAVAICGFLLVITLLLVSVQSLVLLIPLAIVVFITYQRDQLQKTTVLFYDFEPEVEDAYQLLHDWADHLATCSRIWYIHAQGDVYDPKYHAGAGQLIARDKITIQKGQPPFLKTNISTVIIPVGDETLYFFPDRILVYAYNGVGAISYGDFHLEIFNKRFIEDEPVPSDAQVIDYTWRYVNKTGGPDRRFRDNPQIPICLYEEVRFSSQSGLNKFVQLSRTGVTDGFHKALDYLGKILPAHS